MTALPRGSGADAGSRRPSIPAGARPLIGPFASAIGLILILAISVTILTGSVPTLGGGGPVGPVKTPTPSGVVLVDPRGDVHGRLVYVKGGNIWLQSGAEAHQLTTGGADSMPTWAPDGAWIYFIRVAAEQGMWPHDGVVKTYALSVPSLIRIRPDGSGAETMMTGRVTSGRYAWHAFIREPAISPDGRRAAIVTDAPDPTTSDLVLKILDLRSGALTNLRLPESAPLGHQDPAWSPDGSSILYVRDDREGTRGTPVIVRYDLTTKKVTPLTGPGYLAPAWSPNGRFVAATKTGSFGTNVVVLDGKTGAELLRLTNDEASFSPVWSPAGDGIAFFRDDGGVVDLELVKLQGSGPSWTVGDTVALTVSAGLDAGSRASWFIPPNELPTPAPATAAPSAVPASP